LQAAQTFEQVGEDVGRQVHRQSAVHVDGTAEGDE